MALKLYLPSIERQHVKQISTLRWWKVAWMTTTVLSTDGIPCTKNMWISLFLSLAIQKVCWNKTFLLIA